MAEQLPTEWTPTPKQTKVLEVAFGDEQGRNITEICKTANVDRTTFYEWMKHDENFRERWRTLHNRIFETARPAVGRVVVEAAMERDMQAAKIVLGRDLIGHFDPDNPTLPGGPPLVPIQININIDGETLKTIAGLFDSVGIGPLKVGNNGSSGSSGAPKADSAQ